MYRKFTADHIFTGHEILHRDFVLITTADGTIENIVHKDDAGDEVETLAGLLTPGFINAHCHVELSHLKNVIPANTGLVNFVQQVMSKRFLPQDGDFMLEAMQNAEQEMYDGGIVAVGDICNTTDALIVKQGSKIHWQNFVEVSGFTDQSAIQRLDAAKKIAEIYTANQQKTTVSPHAPYSVSKTLFELLNAETGNQLISIHNQECADEDELYQNKTGGFLDLYKNFGIDISSFKPSGKTSLQTWLPYFNNNQSIILVHNTFTSQEDVDFIEKYNLDNTAAGIKMPLYFCLCINANKYIEQKIPPIDLLRKNNCSIILGTDSYASNWQLSIIEEIKTIQHATNFSVPLKEILQWATINGAKALQIDNELGSFEKGKKPGIVLIEGLNGLNTTANSTAKKIL